MPADFEWAFQAGADSRSQSQCRMQRFFLILSKLGGNENELIAAHARKGVGFSDQRAESLRHQLQQCIPRRMAAGIVYILEAVQININNGANLAAQPGLFNCLLNSLAQQREVGLLSERI